ncbi:MAG: polyphosphate kinase 1 [Lentisphaeria bacterium]|nr:polyphosphate kinase 1 [Lentisphaeria bacterium]
MNDRKLFLSRELAWLDFNARVLDEALCEANPLLERLKFISITDSNLDEFFMVRIAGLRRLVRAGCDFPDPAGLRPSEQLSEARKKICKLILRRRKCLDGILRELENYGVRLREAGDVGEDIQAQLATFFDDQVMPVLTPFAVDSAHPFPLLTSGAIVIAVEIASSTGSCGESRFAFVEVPGVLDRFVEVTDRPADSGRLLVTLESVIWENIGKLFPGCRIADRIMFRITRDMDLTFSDDPEGSMSLLESIHTKLQQRKQREAIRLEFCRRDTGKLAAWLKKSVDIAEEFCYCIDSFIYLKQFMQLPGVINMPELLEEEWKTSDVFELEGSASIFDAIKKAGDTAVFLPFHNFDCLTRLLNAAADDPDVLAIKQTLYRVGSSSPVVDALRRAAENGKQVTAVIELRARFDEGNNIGRARALEESGAHVVYGVSGLKVHAKALLIVRREAGRLRRYVHLATGNYNARTAKQYTDIGIISTDPDLCSDAAALFNILTGFSTAPEWKCVSCAPFNLRSRFEELVKREIRFARAGLPAKITAKMNSLSDEGMIRILHEAAAAGVELQLIVRGICCYRILPKEKNVRIISIVDRYLEHSRIFCFNNGGSPEYFLSSADWMSRNLDRRIELLFPVRDEKICSMLRDILNFQLQDSDKARQLRPSGSYTRPDISEYTGNRSQRRTSDYLRNISEKSRNRRGGILEIYANDR